jgi:hypothetical protein
MDPQFFRRTALAIALAVVIPVAASSQPAENLASPQQKAQQEKQHTVPVASAQQAGFACADHRRALRCLDGRLAVPGAPGQPDGASISSATPRSTRCDHGVSVAA